MYIHSVERKQIIILIMSLKSGKTIEEMKGDFFVNSVSRIIYRYDGLSKDKSSHIFRTSYGKRHAFSDSWIDIMIPLTTDKVSGLDISKGDIIKVNGRFCNIVGNDSGWISFNNTGLNYNSMLPGMHTFERVEQECKLK